MFSLFTRNISVLIEISFVFCLRLGIILCIFWSFGCHGEVSFWELFGKFSNGVLVLLLGFVSSLDRWIKLHSVHFRFLSSIDWIKHMLKLRCWDLLHRGIKHMPKLRRWDLLYRGIKFMLQLRCGYVPVRVNKFIVHQLRSRNFRGFFKFNILSLMHRRNLWWFFGLECLCLLSRWQVLFINWCYPMCNLSRWFLFSHNGRYSDLHLDL